MTPSEILKKVRQLDIRTRRLVTESVTGAYHSSFKGRGMDFEEVREYSVGDDVRTIDWNVTAKMDHPYVKVFREERELTMMLLIDLSASGIFGSIDRSKRETAAEIASVLAFSATRNNDKVGLLLYSDRIEHYIPPKKGRRHILRVIRDILFFEPKGRGTRHRVAIDYLNRVQRRKAVVFVVSDFLDDAENLKPGAVTVDDPAVRALAVTNQRHDVICISLSDPREFELPDVGVITLEDAETGEFVEVNTSNRALRKRYSESAAKRKASLGEALGKRGIDFVDTNTGQPYLPALRNLFALRAQRL